MLCFLSGSSPINPPHFVWFPPQTASWHEMLLDALQHLDNVLVNLAMTWMLATQAEFLAGVSLLLPTDLSHTQLGTPSHAVVLPAILLFSPTSYSDLLCLEPFPTLFSKLTLVYITPSGSPLWGESGGSYRVYRTLDYQCLLACMASC